MLIYPQMMFVFFCIGFIPLYPVHSSQQPVDPFLHYCCHIRYSSLHQPHIWSVFCPKTAFFACFYYSVAYWFQASSPICENQCESWSCSPNQPLSASALWSWIKYSLFQQPIYCWKRWGHNRCLQDPTWHIQLWQWTADESFSMVQTLCARSNPDFI